MAALWIIGATAVWLAKIISDESELTTHVTVHTQETTDFAHAQEAVADSGSDTTRTQIAHGTIVRPLMYR